MAIVLSTAARNAGINGIVDLTEGGTGAGNIVIQTAAGAADLAEVTASATAFGDGATGVATLAGVPLSTTGIGDGNAAQFQLRDGDDVVILTGSVTATGGGGDLTVDNVAIATGQTVNITSLSFTLPAS
jgi:hypothetical protein